MATWVVVAIVAALIAGPFLVSRRGRGGRGASPSSSWSDSASGRFFIASGSRDEDGRADGGREAGDRDCDTRDGHSDDGAPDSGSCDGGGDSGGDGGGGD